MATLARFKTFVTGDKLTATQANSIQDMLIDLLDGTTTNVNVTIEYGSNDFPTLRVDNTGGGDIISFQVSGVEKALVNATGQLESTIATGTAPFVVASSTVVANLNAATAADADALGGSAASLYALKTYVDAKTFNWMFPFYVAQPDLGALFDSGRARAGFICPSGMTYLIDRIRYVYASGTPTGTSTLEFRHYNSTGTLQNSITVNMLSSNVIGNSYESNLSDITMADGDYFIMVAGTDNGHGQISCQVEGTETVT